MVGEDGAGTDGVGRAVTDKPCWLVVGGVTDVDPGGLRTAIGHTPDLAVRDAATSQAEADVGLARSDNPPTELPHGAEV